MPGVRISGSDASLHRLHLHVRSRVARVHRQSDRGSRRSSGCRDELDARTFARSVGIILFGVARSALLQRKVRRGRRHVQRRCLHVHVRGVGEVRRRHHVPAGNAVQGHLHGQGRLQRRVVSRLTELHHRVPRRRSGVQRSTELQGHELRGDVRRGWVQRRRRPMLRGHLHRRRPGRALYLPVNFGGRFSMND